MGEIGPKKVEVNLLSERKVDSLWNRLWDLLLRPVKSGKPSQLELDVGKDFVDEAGQHRRKRYTKAKPQKRPKLQQPCLFDLDKFEVERDDIGTRE